MTTLDKVPPAIEGEYLERLTREKSGQDREMMARLLGGGRALAEYTREKFQPQAPRTEAALAACAAFDWTKENLYLHGPTGTGKSHLATVAARRVLERRGWETALKTVTPMEFSRALRRQKDADGEAAVLEWYANIPVLLLEDMGVQKDTDFLLAALYEVVNLRYQDARGGLIITSNLSLGELAAKMNDDRISSRLAQMCQVFSLVGVKDYRVPEKI